MNTKSWTEEQLEIAANQRKRCQESYPDWKDDEFNCVDNLFIWGVSHNPEQTSSFCTLNYIEVYYNRRFQTYYLDIDPEIDVKTMKMLLQKFDSFVYMQVEDATKKLTIEEVMPDLFSASSLEDLLCKFKIFVAGYTAMMEA